MRSPTAIGLRDSRGLVAYQFAQPRAKRPQIPTASNLQGEFGGMWGRAPKSLAVAARGIATVRNRPLWLAIAQCLGRLLINARNSSLPGMLTVGLGELSNKSLRGVGGCESD